MNSQEFQGLNTPISRQRGGGNSSASQRGVLGQDVSASLHLYLQKLSREALVPRLLQLALDDPRVTLTSAWRSRVDAWKS